MKKFRMMLPVMAVVFAVGGAIAGNFFGPITAYRVDGATCTDGKTEQLNCQVSSNQSYPICTIKVGLNHPQAFFNDDCTGVLRDVQP